MRQIILCVSLLIGLAGTVWGQGFSAFIYWEDNGVGNPELPLTTTCGGPTPIPDGSILSIHWDNDSNGPDDDDPLAPLCNTPPDCPNGDDGEVNYNQITMNGGSASQGEGYFVVEYDFVSYGILTQPPRFFLEICYNTALWRTTVFVLSPGPQEVNTDDFTWTCVTATCSACQTPAAPSNFTASDLTSCTGVVLDWDYDALAEGIDRFEISRSDVGLIATLTDTSAETYTDATAPSGTTLTYSIRAHKICEGDDYLSPIAQDPGTREVSPPVAQNVLATDNQCGSVLVTWSYSTNAGLDSFRIKRNGVHVGTVAGGGTPGNRQFLHINAPGGTAQYCVLGFSAECGEGVSACDSGQTLQALAQVQNVNASDNSCLVVTITWTDLPNETSYRLFRNGADIGVTIPPNTTSYQHTPPTYGTVYQFQVRGVNDCGNGALSIADNGSTMAMPSAPSNIQATDNLCAMVTVTWIDVANETGYKVIRGVDTISTVAGNITSYNDQTGTPGTVYNYNVRPFNDCGNGPAGVSNSGIRLAAPASTAPVNATDASCSYVLVSWTNIAGEDSFQIRRDGVRIGSRPANMTTFNDLTATPGQTYTYRVVAWGQCGWGDSSGADQGSRILLPAPTGLMATDDICNSVVVTWDDIAGEDSVTVWRNSMRAGSVMSGATSFSDITAVPWTPHDYFVTTWAAGCSSAASNHDTGYALAVPSVPGSVIASDTFCSHIDVTWNDVQHEVGYILRRNTTVIAVLDSDVTSFTDVPPVGTYGYRVQAFNDCGSGPANSPSSGTRVGAPLSPTDLTIADQSCGVVLLSWANPPGIQTVYVYRNEQLIGSVSASQTTFSDSVGQEGTWLYYLKAENHCALSDSSDHIGANVAEFPDRPDSVWAWDNDCDRVTLYWHRPTGTINYFNVYRDGEMIAVAGDTAYTDVNVYSGVTYAYAVSSVSDECGETIPSPTVQVEVQALTPIPPPEITVQTNGQDVNLHWQPVDTLENGCPVQVSGYLVYYSPIFEGPYYYHGFTADTTYTHVRASQFAVATYYQVISYSGPLDAVMDLPTDGSLSETDVRQRLESEAGLRVGETIR